MEFILGAAVFMVGVLVGAIVNQMGSKPDDKKVKEVPFYGQGGGI